MTRKLLVGLGVQISAALVLLSSQAVPASRSLLLTCNEQNENWRDCKPHEEYGDTLYTAVGQWCEGGGELWWWQTVWYPIYEGESWQAAINACADEWCGGECPSEGEPN